MKKEDRNLVAVGVCVLALGATFFYIAPGIAVLAGLLFGVCASGPLIVKLCEEVSFSIWRHREEQSMKRWRASLEKVGIKYLFIQEPFEKVNLGNSAKIDNNLPISLEGKPKEQIQSLPENSDASPGMRFGKHEGVEVGRLVPATPRVTTMEKIGPYVIARRGPALEMPS